MASYFPDQESVVTVLRYRVVIEEIVVSAEKLSEYNNQANQNDDSNPAYDVLETKKNKFEDWGWGSVMQVADPRNFVGEWGEGYVAFKGDVTSGSDDLFPSDFESWSHSPFEPIPFACNDYYALLGMDDDHAPDPKVVEAMGHAHNLKAD
jgi:hypothetical protein